MIRIFSPSRSITTVVVGFCIVLVVWIAFFVLPSKVFAVAPTIWCCSTYGQADALSTVDKTGLVSGGHTPSSCSGGGTLEPGVCNPVKDYFSCTQGTCGGGGSTGTPTSCTDQCNPACSNYKGFPTCGNCQKKTNACDNSCQGADVGTPVCDVCTLSAPTCKDGCKTRKNCAGSCSGSGVGTPKCDTTPPPPPPVCKDFTIQGPCSASCGGGTKTVTRFNTCGGEVSSDVACNTKACPPTPTLTATLSANPSFGSAPLNNVALSANVGGTATEPITYQFRCEFPGGGFGAISSVNGESCDYASPGNYTAKVRVRRGSLTTEAQRIISVTNPPSLVELNASGKKANSCYDIDWSVDNVVSCTPDSNPDHATWNGTDFNSQIASGIESGTVEVCDLTTATTFSLNCGANAAASVTIAEPFLKEINPGQTSFNFMDFLRGLFPGFVKSSYAG